MIITLAIWLFKKYILPAIQNTSKKIDAQSRIEKIATCCLLTMSLAAPAQEKSFKYRVMNKGEVVGSMQLERSQQGGDLYLEMASKVNMRFVFSIDVKVDESSYFQNGKLIFSKTFRKVNDKVKADRQTKAQGGIYHTIAEGKTGIVNRKSIDCNLMLLYIHEPVDGQEIYSDNFQQFLKVRKTQLHTYRIDLPDGNYNYYFYTNGICSRIDIHHTLYKIQIALI